MPITQIREIAAASRLDNVRYAIRDLVSVADEITKQGHKVLPLNIGDPNVFDFQTPAHLIEAVYGGSCRMMLIFRSRPSTDPGGVLQPLMAPFMSVNLRDELERDLADFAAAIDRHVAV